jgi:hypothetical protein
MRFINQILSLLLGAFISIVIYAICIERPISYIEALALTKIDKHYHLKNDSVYFYKDGIMKVYTKISYYEIKLENQSTSNKPKYSTTDSKPSE